jgi:hypothetical protein
MRFPVSFLSSFQLCMNFVYQSRNAPVKITRADPQFKICSVRHHRHSQRRAKFRSLVMRCETKHPDSLDRNNRTPNVRKPVLCSVTKWPQMNFVTDKCSLLSRKIRKPSVELQKTVPETTDNRAWNYSQNGVPWYSTMVPENLYETKNEPKAAYILHTMNPQHRKPN